ncbi:hypothetical protein [Shinella sp. G-2]|uniref:hypothetical protein n=1 Tax=Shinella sp. G-2 TaxID=3133141 RepID=UPI003D028381
MNGIYFGEGVCLRAYSSASKGTNATIKIELETTDRYDLADILRQLDAIALKQKKATKTIRQGQTNATGTKPTNGSTPHGVDRDQEVER